eukprot:TRINITY_DN67306_c3_g5_i1.p1 TRINITY_DN67306_c3_g5~~TRINITY_DN67306_c3_g5_i1.p1  ORF type:complete len:688 (+),score=375.57 TRINITY_DN67306_c3_g5_i1:22-2064(+)
MSTRRSKISQSRALDNVYDPIYTTSTSQAQSHHHHHHHHHQSRRHPSQQQQQQQARKKKASYKHYFTDKQTKQTQQMQPRPPPGGRTGSARRYAGAQQQKHVAQSQKSAKNGRRRGAARSSGSSTIARDVQMYVKRPMLPQLDSVPADAVLAEASGDAMVSADGRPLSSAAAHSDSGLSASGVPRKRSVGVQSLYRESGAQTDPYTPDYVIPAGAPEPEVLSIAHMKFNQNLPVGLEEVEYIKRMRARREFEASMPQGNDPQSLAIRRKMLEEQEMRDWKLREEEMMKEQEERLQLLVDAMRQREERTSASLQRRVDALRQKKAQERDKKMTAIHRQRVKVLRKLTNYRNKATDTLAKSAPRAVSKHSHSRDIIEEYADYNSKVYAPAQREGTVPPKAQAVDYGIPLISSYQGLDSLEKSLPRRATHAKVRAPKKVVPASQKSRQAQKVAADLEYIDNVLRTGATPKQSAPAMENMYKKFEPLVRPPTPSVEPVDEDPLIAALLLQRLVRGRAVQNEMYEGKENAFELIKELRSHEDPLSRVDVGVQTAPMFEVPREVADQRTAQSADIAAVLRYLYDRAQQHGAVASSAAQASDDDDDDNDAGNDYGGGHNSDDGESIGEDESPGLDLAAAKASELVASVMERVAEEQEAEVEHAADDFADSLLSSTLQELGAASITKE